MNVSSRIFFTLARVGAAAGKGLIAGFAGTVAITLSQMIEMKITKRGMSAAPVKVGGDVLGVEPKGTAKAESSKISSGASEPPKPVKQELESNKEKFGQLMHYGYGTGWGVARGLLDLGGVRGAPATVSHFGAVWGTALVMLPAAGVSEPVTKWSPKTIAIDIVHHAVYAIAAGLLYDAMKRSEEQGILKEMMKRCRPCRWFMKIME